MKYKTMKMKTTIIASAAAAVSLLVAFSACTPFETVKGDALGTKMYTLDNGLKVYMSVNKEQPRIQTYIAVKVGGKNDPDETTGLAHYFEHLMFKGTQQFGTSDYAAEKPMLDAIEALFEEYRVTSDEARRAAIYHRIDSISYEASKIAIPNEYDKLMAIIGADGTNAWTSMDETVYTEDIPSNQVDNWARIQADRFKNTVIRGFHTELETIYEEKNMSLTQDSRKAWEALDGALFPDHPYGTHTVLGTQDHLKNPSITNVKKYHDTFYVPNNIAICLSGDFNPRGMVKVIEKYFGDWQPTESVPYLDVAPYAPLTGIVEKDVYGLEAENVAIGWPLPGASALQDCAVAEIAGDILFNGEAGLIDLDLIQQQKVLSAFAGFSRQPDYSSFIAIALPKDGQTLEQARDLLLGQVNRLRSGDFDESLIEATVNNIKLAKMSALEDNSSRANLYVDAFINGIEWKDASREIERYEAVTKEDVVAWAGKYLTSDAYAVVNKRQGVDDAVKKISAPAITPIATNRDSQSGFLMEIAGTEVKPIEPVFADLKKDLSVSALTDGVEMLYRKNEINDIFHLDYLYNVGSITDPLIPFACDYISYLGTPARSHDEIAARMYELACLYDVESYSGRTMLEISGLAENMPEAMTIVEDLVLNAVPDEEILANLKQDIFKSRINGKQSQNRCFRALRTYMMYGEDFVRKTTLTDEQVEALTSEQLLGAIRDLYAKGHTVTYYGPASESNVKDAVGRFHFIAPDAVALEEVHPALMPVQSASVLLAQYDAKQLYYLQYSNRGERLQLSEGPAIDLYNEYFGGGMNSVVFQEMREARGLAYSAWADLYTPRFVDEDYYYMAFIATQNDKMRQAIEAFDEIINNMPESQAAFDVARNALDARLRTQRVSGKDIFDVYLSCRRLGLDRQPEEMTFEKIQNMTLEDVAATQKVWAKGRPYTYAILGDLNDIDTDYLSTLGPLRELSLTEIFGY